MIAGEMEWLAHFDAVGDQIGACCLDVSDDEKQPLRRARHGGGDLAEGGWSMVSRRCQLHRPPARHRMKSASSRHPSPS